MTSKVTVMWMLDVDESVNAEHSQDEDAEDARNHALKCIPLAACISKNPPETNITIFYT